MALNHDDRRLILSGGNRSWPIEKRHTEIIEEIKKKLNRPEIAVDCLSTIHRCDNHHADGIISFASVLSKSFNELGGIKHRNLKQEIDKIKHELAVDGRFSINASFGTKNRKSFITGLPLPFRKETHLRYLNACYLDIDCYKIDIAFPLALRKVLAAEHEGIIPPVSIICYSGRGMYLMWLLKSEHSNLPEKGYEDRIKLYKKINKALAKRLDSYQKLGIDYDAHDCARLLRVPGSINSKSNHPVVYCVQQDFGGQVPVYTFNVLKRLLNIDLRKKQQKKVKTRADISPVKRPKDPAKLKGYRAVGEYIIGDMLKIEKHIGGFSQGKRGRTLSLLSLSARKAGYSKAKTKKLLSEVAARCQPAYPSEVNDTRIDTIIEHSWTSKNKHYKCQYLASNYGISCDVADELKLKTIRQEKKLSKRKAERLKREQAIQSIEAPEKMTIRQIKKSLQGKGINASISTISIDLKKINEKKANPPKSMRKDEELL